MYICFIQYESYVPLQRTTSTVFVWNDEGTDFCQKFRRCVMGKKIWRIQQEPSNHKNPYDGQDSGIRGPAALAGARHSCGVVFDATAAAARRKFVEASETLVVCATCDCHYDIDTTIPTLSSPKAFVSYRGIIRR